MGFQKMIQLLELICVLKLNENIYINHAEKCYIVTRQLMKAY